MGGISVFFLHRPQPTHLRAWTARRRHAGTEQRLPGGGVRGGRRGQELAGAAVRQGHVSRVVHTDHRGHVPAGDQLQQEHMHAADHRHDGVASVSGHATAVHVQRPRVHIGLLVHVQAVAGGAPAHMAGPW